jgi:DNA-binding transcriptional regulator of glucitol operon
MWWTRRSVGLHITLVVVVPTFLGLFWWQVQRVRQGNTLSWAYVFEWPFFTGYAVYLWWKLVHDQPEQVPVAPSDRPAAPCASAPAHVDTCDDPHAEDSPGVGDQDSPGVGGDDEDEELAAYNRYLLELHTSGRQKRW